MIGHNRIVAGTIAAYAVVMILLFGGFVQLDRSDDFIVSLKESADLDIRSSHAEAVRGAVDGISTMFLTIHTGLFVLVGFAISASLKGERTPSTVAYTCIGLFTVTSLAAFYAAYLARFQLLERIGAGYTDFSSVMDTLSLHGFLLGVASFFSVSAAALLLLNARDADPLNPEPEIQNAPSVEQPPEPQPQAPAAA